MLKIKLTLLSNGGKNMLNNSFSNFFAFNNPGLAANLSLELFGKQGLRYMFIEIGIINFFT